MLCRSLQSAAFLAVPLMWTTVTCAELSSSVTALFSRLVSHAHINSTSRNEWNIFSRIRLDGFVWTCREFTGTTLTGYHTHHFPSIVPSVVNHKYTCQLEVQNRAWTSAKALLWCGTAQFSISQNTPATSIAEGLTGWEYSKIHKNSFE